MDTLLNPTYADTGRPASIASTCLRSGVTIPNSSSLLADWARPVGFCLGLHPIGLTLGIWFCMLFYIILYVIALCVNISGLYSLNI